MVHPSPLYHCFIYIEIYNTIRMDFRSEYMTLKNQVLKNTLKAEKSMDQLQIILGRIDVARERRNLLRDAGIDFMHVQNEMNILKSMYNVFYHYVEVKEQEVDDISRQMYSIVELATRSEE